MKKSVDMIPKNLSSIAPFLVIDVRQDEEVLNQPILGEYKHIKMDELLNNSNLIDPKQNVVFVCAAGIRSKYDSSSSFDKFGCNVISDFNFVSHGRNFSV